MQETIKLADFLNEISEKRESFLVESLFLTNIPVPGLYRSFVRDVVDRDLIRLVVNNHLKISVSGKIIEGAMQTKEEAIQDRIKEEEKHDPKGHRLLKLLDQGIAEPVTVYVLNATNEKERRKKVSHYLHQLHDDYLVINFGLVKHN